MIERIQTESKGIPVLGHAEGICHVYVDKDADLEIATKIGKDYLTHYCTLLNFQLEVVMTRDCLTSHRDWFRKLAALS